MVDHVCRQFHKNKDSDMPVKIARCENAGKKTLFEKQSNSSEWKLSLDFEYTTRDTPQQNSLAGVIFVMIGN